MSGGARAFRVLSAKIKAMREDGPYGHFTRSDLKKIAVLQTRLDVLRARETYASAYHELWDRAELAALEWALGKLAQSDSSPR